MSWRAITTITAATLGALGLLAGSAGAKTLEVPRAYPTIQAAVDAARPGDAINVSPGTYTEEVVIEKDVNLRGAGEGATVIRSPAVLHSYGVHHPDGRGVTAIVRVGQGARVRMSRLTVSGPIPCGIEVTGVQVLQGAALDLSDARVTGIRANPATCAPADAAGRAVVYGMPPHIEVDGQFGSTSFGRVTHVTVDRYQHAGISIAGPAEGEPSNVAIVDDRVVGGWQIPSFQYGIEIGDGAVARISGNIIDGNVCGGPGCGPDPLSEVQGTGILLLTAPAGTRISDNRIVANDVGVYDVASPGCCAIARNRIELSRYFGIIFQDGDGATLDNRITGGQVGIGVVADAVDTTATLRGDRISRYTVAPVQEIECCGFEATAIRR